MATDNDKPKVLGSLAAFSKEAAAFDRQPARFAAADGSFITFPDPMEMDAFESDDLLHVLINADSRVALKRWLSQEDYTKVADAKMTRRAMKAMVSKATTYYEDVFGGQGESGASDS